MLKDNGRLWCTVDESPVNGRGGDMTMKKTKVVSVVSRLTTRPGPQASGAERLEARAGPHVAGLADMHTGHISFVAATRADNVKGPTGYITTTPVDIESLRVRTDLPKCFLTPAGESVFKEKATMFCEVRPKGSMDAESWEAYLGKCLFPWMRGDVDLATPMVVVLDGASVHNITKNILGLLVEFNIILYFLPADTSWSTSPLDLRSFAVHKHVESNIISNIDTCRVSFLFSSYLFSLANIRS